jgi:hypothetical protein
MTAQANSKQAQERDDGGKSQAIAQANSIAQMVASLNCDFERLEELRDELESLKYDVESAEEDGNDHEKALAALAEWHTENDEELRELEEAAGDCESEDDARERIQEDALEVQVRSAWYTPSSNQNVTPDEFYILLCTGGPAVRIMGELDDNMQPSRAWIEYQDWGTPWTQLFGEIEQSTLLEYCQQFYFGE